ncbi:hypothetical protein ACFYRY_21465 [Streptomyces sp. NPDC005263]|uniref:hypothetical protein n=1 Tax=Streptomyces sp. NPDC005263 TaxID=3364711 RepID=UPI003685E936
MARPISGTVQVAVRHILSDRTTGVVTRTRTIKWRDTDYRVRRPATGKQSVELTCSVCEASLLAEVRDEGRTRRASAAHLILAALCAVIFVASLVYAVHQGGKTLPEGESSPALFPVSIIAIFVMFVAAPVLYVRGRAYNGVSMLDAPKPRRGHAIVPIRGPVAATRRP